MMANVNNQLNNNLLKQHRNRTVNVLPVTEVEGPDWLKADQDAEDAIGCRDIPSNGCTAAGGTGGNIERTPAKFEGLASL